MRVGVWDDVYAGVAAPRREHVERGEPLHGVARCAAFGEGHGGGAGAGRTLLEAGQGFDVVHTSLLRRAIQTVNLALDEMGAAWLPVRRSWRLNERHYGALQGLNKLETSQQYGAEQVFAWRRSYDTPPPALDWDDKRHPRFDARYADLAPEQLPATECLADVVERALPYWYDAIVPDLRAGRRVLVGAHGNSLRALVKHLDDVSDEDIAELNIPTGIPLLYELGDDLRPLSSRISGTKRRRGRRRRRSRGRRGREGVVGCDSLSRGGRGRGEGMRRRGASAGRAGRGAVRRRRSRGRRGSVSGRPRCRSWR